MLYNELLNGGDFFEWPSILNKCYYEILTNVFLQSELISSFYLPVLFLV